MGVEARDRALVLVVDDERDILELVTRRLEQAGYEVHTADRGERALELVKRIKPDIIVLDVRMPGMNGYEVTRQIRADAETEGIPVLLLSASVRKDEVSEGFAAGANDYLVKPFRPEELNDRVRALLEGGRPATD